MKRNFHPRKGIAFSIAILIVSLALIPSGGTKLVNSPEDFNDNCDGDIFGLQGHIAFNYNEDDFLNPIPPLSGACNFAMNVSYRVSGLFANKLIYLLGRWRTNIVVELSVEDVPEWAYVRVDPKTVSPMISTKWKSEGCRVQISVDENAPAYEISYFKLKAKSISVKGPFRMLTWINDTEQVEEIPFVPGYFPIIDIIPETGILETPPGKISQLNITMKNLGNGLTIIDSKILNFPSEEWWGYIQPETILDIGESKVVSLLVLAPENYSGYNQIEIAYTGRYYFYDPLNFTVSYGWILTVFYNP